MGEITMGNKKARYIERDYGRAVNEDTRNFAKRLNALIEQKGITSNVLEEYLGVSSGTFSNLRSGETEARLSVILKLSDYFNVDCDYFIRGIKSDNVKTAKMTGLSNDTIEALKSFNASIENKVVLNFLNMLIEELYNNRYICGDICDLIENTDDYFSKLRSAPVKLRYASSAKEVHETGKEIADLSAVVNGGKYVLSEFFGKFLERFCLLTNGISSDEVKKLKNTYSDIQQQVYKDGVNNGEHTGKTE
jgi:DNA-binding helix-turn-helix protein